MLPLLSIIIPSLNESDTICNTVKSALRGSNVEVIVCDGGSRDGTPALAEEAGARVLISPKRGRGHQLNMGALCAKGEILLFLHADTLLPAGFDSLIRDAVNKYEADGGAFQLSIDGNGLGFRIVEAMANIRSKWWRMPYGDQAFFIKRPVFRRLGGYKEIPFMEDFDFIRRFRKEQRLVILSAKIVTSGRRWRNHGLLKTTILNQLIIAAYLCGVSPQRLAGIYYGTKSMQKEKRCTPHQ